MSAAQPDTPPRELVERIFFAVLDRPEGERDAFLSESCEGNAALEAAVRGLLEAHEHTGAIDRLESEFAAMRKRMFGPLPAGETIGPYEIVELIDAGGMGQVYRARDPRLGREVAVKVLLDAYIDDPAQVKRFEQEARTAAALSDPAILAVFDVGSHHGVPYLVSELLEGESLRRRLQDGPLQASEVIDLAILLVRGIAVAHAAGIVHRDLKPENLFLTRDRRLKILDFGLAKLSRRGFGEGADEMEDDLTEPGRILGTIGYMSPEQVRGERVDERSDLFAVGAVLYEALTGAVPFRRASKAETLAAILHEPPSAGAEGLPPALQSVVLRCLEKDPADRFQSARDLLLSLEDARDRESSGAGLHPQGETADERRPLIARRPYAASIAVLPFVNRSASADDEYFSDGLADELLNLLAKIRGLRVSARASSFQFKGKEASLAEVGRTLRVATILDGSVRRSGNRVRISVQLVNVADGYPLWSETYGRTMDDIFAVQDDIARSVVQELRSTLLGVTPDSSARGRARAEVDRAARGRSRDPEAYRLYLHARHLMDRYSREETELGIAHLEQAIDRDPAFALAWAELSVAQLREAGFGSIPVAEGYARAREAVERSLALEPDLVEGHAQAAWIRIFLDWDWPAARASLARALELAPSNASVLRLDGVLASILGSPQKAISLFRRALEQDPLSPAVYHSLAVAFLAADSFAEAEEAFRRALELAPRRLSTRAHLALAALGQGRTDEALAEAQREPEVGFRLWALALIHHARGEKTEAEDALRGLTDEHAGTYALQIAEIHAVRGELDTAFEWLERARAGRDIGLVHLKTDPRLRSLHGDSRWEGLLGTMGLRR